MKNKVIVFLLMILMVLPLTVYAKSDDYNTKNLTETLKDESIDPEFKNYEENNNQITIYMFRGKGCGYCRAFLTFLNSITEEYGKYFKLESYEVWNDSKNKDLMDKVSSFIGQPAQGVPYIIIGEKVFPGYANTYDEQIKAAITSLYNTNKSDRYDVMKEYKKSLKSTSGVSSTKVIIWNLVFVTVATLIVMVFVNFKFKQVNESVAKIEKSINKTNKPSKETKEIKKK